MDRFRVEVALTIKFQNTEKEQFNPGIINELLEFLEFNEYEIIYNEHIDTNYKVGWNNNLAECREYVIGLTSSKLNFYVNEALEVCTIINNFFDTSTHSGSVTNRKLTKVNTLTKQVHSMDLKC